MRVWGEARFSRETSCLFLQLVHERAIFYLFKETTMPRPKQILTPEEVELKRLQKAEYARTFYATNAAYRARNLERARARMAAGSEARKAATRERKAKARADALAAAEVAACEARARSTLLRLAEGEEAEPPRIPKRLRTSK